MILKMAARVLHKKKKMEEEEKVEESDHFGKQFVRVLGTMQTEFTNEKYLRTDRFEDLEKIERDEFPTWLDVQKIRDAVWTALVKQDIYIIADDSDAIALISHRPTPVADSIRELAANIAYLPGVGTEYAAAKKSFERNAE